MTTIIQILGVKQANTPKCIIDDTVLLLAMKQSVNYARVGNGRMVFFYDKDRWKGRRKKKLELCNEDYMIIFSLLMKWLPHSTVIPFFKGLVFREKRTSFSRFRHSLFKIEYSNTKMLILVQMFQLRFIWGVDKQFGVRWKKKTTLPPLLNKICPKRNVDFCLFVFFVCSCFQDNPPRYPLHDLHESILNLWKK